MAATRRLAAILAADVAGWSRLMGADEEGTLAALKAIRRELTDPLVAEHNGRIVARLRAITSVMVPDAGYLRSADHRELFLSGLRLAIGEGG